MRTLPAIIWSLQREKGSGETEELILTGEWRLVEIDNVGSAPVEYNTVLLHEIDGALVSGYTIQPRAMSIGIMYTGAKNQKEYYQGRRRLGSFVRPNQYKATKLFVSLPNSEIVYLDVYPTPGAPMSLARDRSRIFLEPVSLTAYDPIWRTEDNINLTSAISLSSVTAINPPNKATIAVSTDTGAVTHNSIKVDLGIGTGSGGSYSGFYAEIKKTSEADFTYVRTDVGSATEHTFSGLDDQTSYSIRAIAYNSGGNGATSNVRTQVTPQYVPPLAAPGITFSKTPTSITLNWDAVTNATGYRVRYKLSTNANFGNWQSISSTTYTVSSLQQQVTYNFEIQASFRLDDNTIAYGTTTDVSVMTEQFDPPGEPRNVNERSTYNDRLGESNRYWTWSAPNTGGPVTLYRIQRYDYPHSGSVTTTNTEYHIQWKGRGSRSYRLRAEGPGGESSYVTG